jgi:acyl-CoA reductase-like NAD-dependent aldehyde dehydrogenase
MVVRRGTLLSRCGFAFSSFGKYPFLAELGLHQENQGAYYDGKWQVTDSSASLTSVNPATAEEIARTKCATVKDFEKAISGMQQANKEWRDVPMPVRGDIVRQIGEAFRAKKESLGKVLSLEMGKITSEGQG